MLPLWQACQIPVLVEGRNRDGLVRRITLQMDWVMRMKTKLHQILSIMRVLTEYLLEYKQTIIAPAVN